MMGLEMQMGHVCKPCLNGNEVIFSGRHTRHALEDKQLQQNDPQKTVAATTPDKNQTAASDGVATSV